MRRRSFIRWLGSATLGATAGSMAGCPDGEPEQPAARKSRVADALTLFLCGDVMLGRAVDQILPHPSDPVLYETHVRDARQYLGLAERRNGPIARPAPWSYVWGDALAILARWQPHARIVNLETSITRSATPWPGKAVQYRMHPDNVPCLAAVGIDCCVLSNNHVLDWGRAGLDETLSTLRHVGVATAGAGVDLGAAQVPAILSLRGGGRVLVFAAATGDSGVPAGWAATATRSGVHLLPDLSPQTLAATAENIRRYKRTGDCVVFSVHWGGNWGYDIARAQRSFAHALIDEAGVDVVHGHSSHHVRAIEVHHERPILHGCGDFIDDYEGIPGEEDFRGDLGLMYFPQFDRRDGRLLELFLVPTRIQHFRVNRAGDADRRWLLARLRREAQRFGCDVELAAEDAFALRW
jgi:poly-gamma-glutamate synthesis protein (capsule biosynthesis protein)